MDNYAVTSVTGVDLKISLAGPGARSYAFVLDWHIRLLVALAWFVAASFLVNGTLAFVEGEGADQTLYMLAVVTPASAIYFLYHPVLEIVMRGRSPGKRMAGVRVVTIEGETPGPLALLIRNVMRLIDSLPVGYMIGLLATMISRDSVRIGDLAAGTLLVYEIDDRARVGQKNQHIAPDAVARFGLKQVELGMELLERWDDLSSEKRQALARRMIEQLGGTVEVSHDEGLRAQLKVLLFQDNHVSG